MNPEVFFRPNFGLFARSQPSASHWAVERFVHPDEFEELERYGDEIGFKHVISGPMVGRTTTPISSLTAIAFFWVA